MRRFLKWLLFGLLLLLVGMFVKMFFTGSLQPQIPFKGKAVDNPAALSRLAEMLRFRTISYDDSSDGITKMAALEKMHVWLSKNYPLVYQKAVVTRIGAGSVIIRLSGTNNSLKPALFLAHLDVVPTDPSAWLFDPFSGKIANDTLYGRGTLDDKSIACAMLEALENRLSQNKQNVRSIIIALGHDEETGGVRGAAEINKYLQSQKITAEFICDEGFGVMEGLVPGVQKPVAIIGIAEKGYLSVKLSVDIAGGHSSFPKKENATAILIQGLAKAENYDMREIFCEPQRKFFRAVAPEASFGYRLLFSNLWITSPMVKAVLRGNNKTAATIRTTHATTILKAGEKDNTLPAHAEAVVNFRILPGETVGSVMAELKRNLNDERIVLQANSDSISPSPVSPTDGLGWGYITTTIHECFENVVTAPGLVLTGTDCKNYYAISKNIYRFVPLRLNSSNISGIHGSNEKIAAKNYYEAIHYYTLLFEKI